MVWDMPDGCKTPCESIGTCFETILQIFADLPTCARKVSILKKVVGRSLSTNQKNSILDVVAAYVQRFQVSPQSVIRCNFHPVDAIVVKGGP